MAKKLSVDVNLFEDIKTLGLVSHIRDYRLAYFINNVLGIQLKRYADFTIGECQGSYSWYYFTEGGNYHNISLLNNNHEKGKLVPDHKVDYLIMVKNVFDEQLVSGFMSKLRKVNDISMVFEIETSKIKKIDILLEAIEMHELKQVIRPKEAELKKQFRP